jgi:hypothetical protein
VQKCREQLEITTFLNIALGLGAITLVQAAGYFFKLNKNLVAGACTIMMVGMWFGIQTAREGAIRQTPSRYAQ